MQIFILALEDVFDTGLTVTLDAFSTANALAAKLFGGTPRFEVHTVGMRRRVKTSQGLMVPVEAIPPGTRPDWVIIPAVLADSPTSLLAKLERPDVREARSRLLQWSEQGTRIGAACLGTFILAEAGLLDHREATTSWSFSPLFRRRYPHVQLNESRLVVPNSIGVTAGAAMGHLDLAMCLIRQASPELATAVSRYLLADSRTSQAPYIIPNHLAQVDPILLRFEQWARAHLKDGFSLQEAAKVLATSARTLQRRCEAVLGKSPLAFFQDLRVEHAQMLLRRSEYDIESIAAEVGYADGATLRTLLRDRLGRGVREIRAGLE
jgi:transcriptional regulator GlxA family with amidase domain